MGSAFNAANEGRDGDGTGNKFENYSDYKFSFRGGQTGLYGLCFNRSVEKLFPNSKNYRSLYFFAWNSVN